MVVNTVFFGFFFSLFVLTQFLGIKVGSPIRTVP